MIFKQPGLFADLNRMMTGRRVALDRLRAALFAQPVPVDDLVRYHRLAQPESHRAVWDMMLFNLPHPGRVLRHLPGGADSLLVLGAEQDMIIPAALVDMTARSYGAQAKLYPGMGHGLMLEAGWRKPAQDISDWLKRRF